jgi:hypothetical protein
MWIRFIVPIILIVHCVRAATLLVNRMGDKWRAGLKRPAFKCAASSLLWKGIDTQLAFNVKSSSLIHGRGRNRLPTRGIEPSYLGDAFGEMLLLSGLFLAFAFALTLFLFLSYRHAFTGLLSCCFHKLQFIS